MYKRYGLFEENCQIIKKYSSGTNTNGVNMDQKEHLNNPVDKCVLRKITYLLAENMNLRSLIGPWATSIKSRSASPERKRSH
jgi:hypothetical protein